MDIPSLPFRRRNPPDRDDPLSPQPWPERLRSQLGSLRFRLTVWNTIVVLGASLAALLALREGALYTLQKEADSLLRDETAELGLAVQQLHPDQEAIFEEFGRKAAGHAPHGWFVQLLSADGASLWASENTPAPLRQGRTIDGHAETPFSWGDYRVSQRFVNGADAPDYMVRIGVPTEWMTAEVKRLMQLLFPIALALVVLAPLGGYLLARRATLPIRQIIATTRRLRPSRLDERLPLGTTGDELDQLSIEINSFLDQIAGYLQRHREFVGNAAHELRSPLTAIQASVDVALAKPRTPEEYRELLFSLSHECEQLRLLVNQLMILAENDAVGLERPGTAARMDEIVQNSVDVFDALAEDRGIHLESHVQVPVIVPGDATRLRQVVNNLLDNALKFTQPGGSVTVSLQRDDARQHAALTVQDTGMGIPSAELHHVFERFYQVDKSRQRDERRGNGLGLSIVQLIVQLHGGLVEVESEAGCGATFRVVLPLSPVAAAAPANPLAPPKMTEGFPEAR